MRYSKLFTKTQKEAPKDEVAKNAQLLIRAGYVYKEMAGVYTLLPLGVRVVDKIANIIREEMNAIGGVETQSAALQKKDSWEKSGRWDDEVLDVWFKTSLKNGTELGLASTHEEPTTAFMKSFIESYKDLPVYNYDIRTIFRNETRAKSGLMRGREFFWKALYSFSADKQQHDEFYEKAKQAYVNVYERVGLGDRTYLTFALGGSFSKYSHEFQTISEAGEDTIYIDEDKKLAINEEAYTDEILADLGVDKKNLVQKKAIEVGNIFSLAHKFSDALDLKYKDAEGNLVPVYMGSYGIGVTRVLGTIAEELSDEQGLVWPESVAPFQVHIVILGESEDVQNQAEKLYQDLESNDIDVFIDDRVGVSAGAKLADADLLGMPHRVIVSAKSLDAGGYEYKQRTETESIIVNQEELLKKLV
jgi:prolyl-tRNA synthetase